MVKRAVTYARVSSNDAQKTGGENLAEQTRLCQEYAEQQGYQIVANLAEDERGASGAILDLPQLSKALRMAHNNAFDVLIVREIDRLSRSLAKQLYVEQELERAGITIEYVLYDFPDTPEGSINKHFRAIIAEYEREKIKQRMRSGLKRKAKDGHVILHSKAAPYGYCKVTNNGNATIEIDEEQARIIRLIFKWYVEGDETQKPLSMEAIAQRLTSEGIPTWSQIHDESWRVTKGRWGKWSRSFVWKILSSETYIGKWYYGKEEILVEVPPIVDNESWEKAQERKKKNYKHARRNTKHPYLLQYRITCGECGRKLRTHSRQRSGNKPKILYYVCHTREQDYSCEQGHYFRARKVDAATWNILTDLFRNTVKLEESLRTYQAQKDDLNKPYKDRLEVIDGMLEEKQKRLDRLLDLYLSGNFELDTLNRHKVQLENETDALQAEKARIQERLNQEELSEENLQAVLEFSQVIGEGIAAAEADFSKRRALIETLDIQAELVFEDNQELLTLYCPMLALPEGVLIEFPGIRTKKRKRYGFFSVTIALQAAKNACE